MTRKELSITIVLPDYTVSKQIYTATATTTYRNRTVIVHHVLDAGRSDNVQSYNIHIKRVTRNGKPVEFDVRKELVKTTKIALEAAGWIYDVDYGLWIAPLSVQLTKLTQIA